MAKKTKKQIKTKKSNSMFSQIKWGESYTSLFLGALVVVIAIVLVFSFIKTKNSMLKDTSSTSTENTQALDMIKGRPYTVKVGDDLWHIAQNTYGSGYNWVDIAKANNLENPGVLYSGTKLTLPNVKQRLVDVVNTNLETTKVLSNSDSRIMGNSYRIKRGDDLWNIAVRAYGDGYKWVDIAKANALSNPDLIHADNILVLPR